VNSSVVTLATFHLLKASFIELAWEKVFKRVVTAVVFHEFKPTPVKRDALWNVSFSVVTFDTTHLLSPAFIELAP
jgi:hypothetical protein